MRKTRVLQSNVLTPGKAGEVHGAVKGAGLFDNFALMTVNEAARFLRMSEAWLYQSNVPFVRMDSARRYRRIDLIQYAEQRLSRAVQVVGG